MNTRSLSWFALPLLLLLTGCPESGGGDGGFGNGATGIAYVVNTGPNEISTYTIDVVGTFRSAGTVALADVPSSIAVSSDSAFAFVGTNNGVHAFRVNSVTGGLASVSGSPFSAGNNFTAVTVSQNSRFLYVANNNGTVDAYSINATTGSLTLIETENVGTSPSGVAVSPNGSFLYVSNQGSNNVSAFTINGTTGALTGIGVPVAAGTSPSGITIEPDGQFLYVSNRGGGGNVSGYRITTGTGELISLGAAFPAGTTPVGIATPGRP